MEPGAGAEVGVGPGEKSQEGALEIGARELLFSVRPFMELPINLLSSRYGVFT